jgi:hypothetical protein
MTDVPQLIGLYSPAPRSGKSTVASYLTEHGFYTVSFATPLKRMIRTFLIQFGYGPEDIDYLLTDGKHEQIRSLGVTPRQLLQTLGTEWGRTCIHPDVWLKCWRSTADRYLSTGVSIVCDDIRFPNEADLIRSLGGQLWRVHRPEAERATTHASEGSLDNFPHFDRRITNDGTLLDLYSRVKSALPTPISLAA